MKMDTNLKLKGLPQLVDVLKVEDKDKERILRSLFYGALAKKNPPAQLVE